MTRCPVVYVGDDTGQVKCIYLDASEKAIEIRGGNQLRGNSRGKFGSAALQVDRILTPPFSTSGVSGESDQNRSSQQRKALRARHTVRKIFCHTNDNGEDKLVTLHGGPLLPELCHELCGHQDTEVDDDEVNSVEKATTNGAAMTNDVDLDVIKVWNIETTKDHKGDGENNVNKKTLTTTLLSSHTPMHAVTTLGGMNSGSYWSNYQNIPKERDRYAYALSLYFIGCVITRDSVISCCPNGLVCRTPLPLSLSNQNMPEKEKKDNVQASNALVTSSYWLRPLPSKKKRKRQRQNGSNNGNESNATTGEPYYLFVHNALCPDYLVTGGHGRLLQLWKITDQQNEETNASSKDDTTDISSKDTSKVATPISRKSFMQCKWQAKNLPADFLGMAVPQWERSACFIEYSDKEDHSNESERSPQDKKRKRSPAFLIAVGTNYGQVRLYNTGQSQRPIGEIDFGGKKMKASTAPPITAICQLRQSQSGDKSRTKTSVRRKAIIIACGDTEGCIRRVNLNTWQLEGTYKGSGGSIRQLTEHPSRPWLASVSLDRTLRIHHTSTRRLLHKVYLNQRLTCFAWGTAKERSMNDQAATSTEEFERAGYEAEEDSDNNDEDADALWQELNRLQEAAAGSL
eukprot:g3382.t1